MTSWRGEGAIFRASWPPWEQGPASVRGLTSATWRPRGDIAQPTRGRNRRLESDRPRTRAVRQWPGYWPGRRRPAISWATTRGRSRLDDDSGESRRRTPLRALWRSRADRAGPNRRRRGSCEGTAFSATESRCSGGRSARADRCGNACASSRRGREAHAAAGRPEAGLACGGRLARDASGSGERSRRNRALSREDIVR